MGCGMCFEGHRYPLGSSKMEWKNGQFMDVNHFHTDVMVTLWSGMINGIYLDLPLLGKYISDISNMFCVFVVP